MDPDGQFAIPVLIIGVGLLYAALKTYYDNVNYSNSSSNSFSGFNDTGIYSTDGLGEPNFAKKKPKESNPPSPFADTGSVSVSAGGAMPPNDDDNNQEDPTEKEYKKPKSGSGKEKADDIPSWAEGKRPYKGENGKDFAKRLCDEHFGKGNWKEGAGSDFNKIRKWGDRGFE